MCDVSTWRCVLLWPVSGNVWCLYMVCYCYLCQAVCDVPTCRCVIVTCVRQCVMYLHGGVCCCYLFQVICGQNCTFLVQANGSLLACGEGSYGRLGQGNSDDVHAPTIITSLQGNFLLMMEFNRFGIIWSLEKGKDWWSFFLSVFAWKSLYLLNKCLVHQLKEIKIKAFCCEMACW